MYVYVKEACNGGQQATIGYISGHMPAWPGAREARIKDPELLARKYWINRVYGALVCVIFF